MHRDIKPNNILVKCNEMFRDGIIDVCLIDYGFAKKYMQENGAHVEAGLVKQVPGMAQFKSVNALNR